MEVNVDNCLRFENAPMKTSLILNIFHSKKSFNINDLIESYIIINNIIEILYTIIICRSISYTRDF